MFNKSMFTGHLSEEEMAHEHGRELEAIARGTAERKIEPQVLRTRQMVYFPIATVIGLVLAFGIYKIVTLENTAPITTVPNPVNVAVLVTATPQATPTRAPTPVPTPAPTVQGGAATAVQLYRCAGCAQGQVRHVPRRGGHGWLECDQLCHLDEGRC